MKFENSVNLTGLEDLSQQEAYDLRGGFGFFPNLFVTALLKFAKDAAEYQASLPSHLKK